MSTIYIYTTNLFSVDMILIFILGRGEGGWLPRQQWSRDTSHFRVHHRAVESPAVKYQHSNINIYFIEQSNYNKNNEYCQYKEGTAVYNTNKGEYDSLVYTASCGLFHHRHSSAYDSINQLNQMFHRNELIPFLNH